MGPEGGKFGGEIIAKGTPEELVKKFKKTSHTAHYLEQELLLGKNQSNK
jgi:excinuclease ABC subunit A